MNSRALQLKAKAEKIDINACYTVNRMLKHVWVHRFFAVISRLGDGVLWYVTLLLLPLLYGMLGVKVSIVLTLLALWNVYVYKKLKLRLARPRPFALYPFIQKGTSVLDEYSFPSGHTLHAVTFALVLSVVFPWLALLVVPFAVLTAASRVILGVHFPSDVLFGMALGLLHGWLAILFLEVFVL